MSMVNCLAIPFHHSSLSSIVILFSFIITFQHHFVQSIPVVDCPEHSTLNPCMSRCPTTCSNYHLNPPDCLPICQHGCECHQGFIKVSKNPYSPCVREYECELYITTKRNSGLGSQQFNNSKPYNPFKKSSSSSDSNQNNGTNNQDTNHLSDSSGAEQDNNNNNNNNQNSIYE